MQVPVPQINDIFISHLHVDHYHDLSYLFPFRASFGGWTSSADAPSGLPAVNDAPGPKGVERVVHTMSDKAQADVAIKIESRHRSMVDHANGKARIPGQ